MDPNATLARIRELLEHDNGTADEWIELIELMQAMDSWLSSGGVLPEAWSNAEDRLPDHLIAVPKDSCEAEHPISHLQCWLPYGHHEKDGSDHMVGDDRWSEED